MYVKKEELNYVTSSTYFPRLFIEVFLHKLYSHIANIKYLRF